jgi:hypothetical protein
MKRNKPVNRCLADLLAVPVTVFCLFLMGVDNHAWAGKPGGGGGDSTTPLDTGTIYYYGHDSGVTAL